MTAYESIQNQIDLAERLAREYEQSNPELAASYREQAALMRAERARMSVAYLAQETTNPKESE